MIRPMDGFYYEVPQRLRAFTTGLVDGRRWVSLRNRNPMPQIVLFPRLDLLWRRIQAARDGWNQA